MRLNLGTDYALRTLIYLAAGGDRLATIAEIAACFSISRQHLMKVVYGLGQAGFVATARGKGGGLRLARPAAAITVGEVVRATEEDLAVMGCLAAPGFCRIEGCCVLRQALAEATRAFLRTLDGYTLAELAVPGGRLAGALGLAGEPPSRPWQPQA